MTPARRRAGAALLACLPALALPQPARAGELSLESIGPAPQQILSAPVHAVLRERGVRVLRGGRTMMEVWLRRDLPLVDDAAAGLGVTYGRILPGMLVGVLTTTSAWTDYRGGTLPGGTYLLRYSLQPTDGNHMGVSTYRDFLIPIAPGDDPGPGELIDQPLLNDLGMKLTGTNHPAVIALYPLYEEVEDPPRLVQNDLDQWMVAATAGEMTVGIVVEGSVNPDGL